MIGVLELLGTVKLPPQVLTFNWKQIKVTWGIAAAAIMLGYLIMDKSGASLKFGAWFMLLGSLAMAAGSIMGILGLGANTVAMPGGQPGSRSARRARCCAAASPAAAVPGWHHTAASPAAAHELIVRRPFGQPSPTDLLPARTQRVRDAASYRPRSWPSKSWAPHR